MFPFGCSATPKRGSLFETGRRFYYLVTGDMTKLKPAHLGGSKRRVLGAAQLDWVLFSHPPTRSPLRADSFLKMGRLCPRGWQEADSFSLRK